MSRLTIIIIYLVSAGTVCAETELKGSPEELRQFLHPAEQTVTLAGTHEETTYSDKAIVGLVMTTEAERLGDSMQANTDLRNEISRTLVDAGVDVGAINTAKFASSPQFGWFGSNPKSFEVVNRMSVSITNEAHLQLIARLTDENDDIVMADMKFEHTEKESTQENVRTVALDKALSRKSVYEERLGVRLTPINFTESAATPYPRRRNASIEEVVVTSNRQSAGLSTERKMSLPQQTFDEVIYQSTVYVTFKIEQSAD